eukprot:jgi/Psemu1/44368/gm1.44368_g
MAPAPAQGSESGNREDSVLESSLTSDEVLMNGSDSVETSSATKGKRRRTSRKSEPDSSSGRNNSFSLSSLLSPNAEGRPERHQREQKGMRMSLRDLMFKSDLLGPIPNTDKEDYAQKAQTSRVEDDGSLAIEEFYNESSGKGGNSSFNEAETAIEKSFGNFGSEPSLDIFSDRHFRNSLQAYSEQTPEGSLDIYRNEEHHKRRRSVCFEEDDGSCPNLIEDNRRLSTQSTQALLGALDIFHESEGGPYVNDEYGGSHNKKMEEMFQNMYKQEEEENANYFSDEEEDSENAEQKIVRGMLYSLGHQL